MRDLIALIRRPSFDDEFASEKLRQQFVERHQIKIGLYSYGCFDRDRIDPKTTIGRYCSFARTATVLNRNHGIDFIGTTAYLHNPFLGIVDNDSVMEFLSCDIGDDVWVGHNATITPSVRSIGRGAIIAAGAVVTKDVAPYAIVAGSPGREMRKRFDDETIQRIEATRWWEWDLDELKRRVREESDLVYRPAMFLKDTVSRG